MAKREVAMALRWGSLIVLLVMALSFRGGISQEDNSTGHSVKRMRLLSYFPCTTARSPDECDVFAYAAAVLAVEEVNWLLSSDLLPGRALENVVFELVPVSETDNDPNAVSFHSSELWLDDVAGVIGPFYPEVAARVVPIATNNLNVLSITYAVTDVSIDESVDKKGFYRSLPSDTFLSKARLNLLLRFDWLKIAVLSSTERTYSQEANNFIRLFEDWAESQSHDIPIAYFREFIAFELLESGLNESKSLKHTLNEMAKQDIGLRIILGYFGPRNARRVICMANYYGLLSEDHVWILPSYSTAFWWELSDADLQLLPEEQRCSNDEMANLLQSTIFFSAVKLPAFDFAVYNLTTGEGPQNITGERPVNNSLSFYDRLGRKTQELFPKLSRNGTQPLERYLYSSQAQRAYEATWLMSWSLIQVLRNNGTTSHVEWLEIAMVCELCRIYNECLFENKLNNPSHLCHYCDRNEYTDALREWTQDYYGQVVVSQYTGGFRCPVAVSFPVPLHNIEVVLVLLNDSAEQCIRKSLLLNESMPFDASCPLNFRWKGDRTTPPYSGYSFTNSFVHLGIIFDAVIPSLVSVYGGIILIINIVWRNNTFIKASSPHLNILLIVPLMILPWDNLLDDINYSVLNLNISPSTMSAFCQLDRWMHFPPLIVFYATLLVKNLRVYRIFHNKRSMSKLKWISDAILIVQVVLFSLPVLIFLIVITAIDPNTAKVATFNRTMTLYDYNFIKISYCSAEFPYVWDPCLIAYTLLLAGLATMFGLLNSHIPAKYREDSAASYRAVAVLVSLLVIEAIVVTILSITRLLFATLLWILTAITCAFTVAALTILFVPRFVCAYLEYKKIKLFSKKYTSTNKKLLVLKSKKAQLQQELVEKEKLIRNRKTERVLFVGHPVSNKEDGDH